MVASKVDVASVRLWGHSIGAVVWDDAGGVAAFEYEPDFLASSIELAPLMMPLRSGVFRFPALANTSFNGLPGLLADSLPDDFGNAVINQWLMREGRELSDFSPVERLCYIGRRGTGAIEYRPATRRSPGGSVPIEIAALVDLAQDVVSRRNGLALNLNDDGDKLDDILRVGTSAGGARAKAVVAWNRDTGEMRSGQVPAPAGFEYWILKFDGVDNAEHGLSDPQGFGRIEFAYHLMARAAGIHMSECNLLNENGRSHFMTRRFDRHNDGEKIHMQSLFAMAHLDNQLAGAHSYEQAFSVMQSLHLLSTAFEEQFRRMVFNVVARNQDDHTKNIAYLMDKDGEWSLSPAFDVIYAYNPNGSWTSQHQMSINGLRGQFTRADFQAVSDLFGIPAADEVIDTVVHAVGRWSEFAAEAGVPAAQAAALSGTFRLL